jgi:hypothetical protein
MKKQPRAEKKIIFNEVFQLRLNSYAIAAGAAGISLLALATPSAAEIIYTKVHQVIGANTSYGVDFNHDGTVDLTIGNKTEHSCGTFCGSNGSLAAVLPGSNQVVADIYGAVAMKAGMRIGPGDPFKVDTQLMGYGNFLGPFPNGSWINVNSRYLGVKFTINGETHYGWARLTVQVKLPIFFTATLTGYAFETVPNKSIIAGQTREANDEAEPPELSTGTLGRLALGRK